MKHAEGEKRESFNAKQNYRDVSRVRITVWPCCEKAIKQMESMKFNLHLKMFTFCLGPTEQCELASVSSRERRRFCLLAIRHNLFVDC